MNYLDDEWYAFRNRRAGTGGGMWQARTVKGDDLIASAYTKEHIERIVSEHNAARVCCEWHVSDEACLGDCCERCPLPANPAPKAAALPAAAYRDGYLGG